MKHLSEVGLSVVIRNIFVFQFKSNRVDKKKELGQIYEKYIYKYVYVYIYVNIYIEI